MLPDGLKWTEVVGPLYACLMQLPDSGHPRKGMKEEDLERADKNWPADTLPLLGNKLLLGNGPRQPTSVPPRQHALEASSGSTDGGQWVCRTEVLGRTSAPSAANKGTGHLVLQSSQFWRKTEISE